MNLQKLMKQAQEMQGRMQREMAALEIEAVVGGGMVALKMNGLKELLAVRIDPEVLDPKDPGMLEDLILAAYREASRQVDEEMQGRLGALASGLPGGLPGGFPGF